MLSYSVLVLSSFFLNKIFFMPTTIPIGVSPTNKAKAPPGKIKKNVSHYQNKIKKIELQKIRIGINAGLIVKMYFIIFNFCFTFSCFQNVIWADICLCFLFLRVICLLSMSVLKKNHFLKISC